MMADSVAQDVFLPRLLSESEKDMAKKMVISAIVLLTAFITLAGCLSLLSGSVAVASILAVKMLVWAIEIVAVIAAIAYFPFWAYRRAVSVLGLD